MNARPSLAELRALAAIAAHRSFRRAADDVGLAPSTLSHMMTQLEGRLGARLLNRTTRSVSLTHAGARLVERLGPLLDQLDAILNDVGDEAVEPAGPLRITASETVAMFVVRHALPVLTARYPLIALDLVAEPNVVDIVAEGYDAGIRLGDDIPRDMIAARIGGDSRMIVVATPGYLEGRPVPAEPEDLRSHACICSRTPGGRPYQWEFAQQGKAMKVPVTGPVTLNRTELMLEAALNGVGIGYVPERIARPHIDSGRLVALLAPWCPSYPGLFVFYPGQRLVPPALRAFIAVMKETMGAD